ncbi:MAG: hypothetical protein HFH82_05200 [Lachnospiraceae bacterium]|nr:hypothetical protein [Lachnospiraceae bacterium]
MKNSLKDVLKKMVVVALVAGILVTIPNPTPGESGDEPGVRPCGDYEQEYNQFS